MGWIKKIEAHVCDRPKEVEPGQNIQPGDIWECDTCGKKYAVNQIWAGDQREPLEPGQRPQIVWGWRI